MFGKLEYDSTNDIKSGVMLNRTIFEDTESLVTQKFLVLEIGSPLAPVNRSQCETAFHRADGLVGKRFHVKSSVHLWIQ